MTSARHAAPEPSGGSREARVSVLQGDRLCIRCGFNLVGQTVVREPVYGMLMVRCPECNTPASLQEYPLLGRWAARWAAVLAALWMLVLAAMLFATAGVLLGMSLGIGIDGGRRATTLLERAHRDWFKSLDDEARAQLPQWITANLQSSGGSFGWLDQSWWEALDKGAFLAAHGGWRRVVAWEAASYWPLVLVIATMAGAIWSVFLLGVPRRRLMLILLAPVALAAALQYAFGDQGRAWMAGIVSASDAAFGLVGWRLFALTLALAPFGLWAGALCGRPLARLLARTLLPPRMLGSMAFLWIADGRPVPRPRRPDEP